MDAQYLSSANINALLMEDTEQGSRIIPRAVASVVNSDEEQQNEHMQEERVLQQLLSESVRAEHVRVVETQESKGWEDGVWRICLQTWLMLLTVGCGVMLGAFLGSASWQTFDKAVPSNSSSDEVLPSPSPSHIQPSPLSPTTAAPTTLERGQRVSHVMEVFSSFHALDETKLAVSKHRQDALEWILSLAHIQSSKDILQCFLIALLYFSTSGPSVWSEHTTLYPHLPICLWTFLNCDATGSISKIELGGNGLVGTIAPELFLLSKLTTLDLKENLLTGTIPSKLCNASRLQEIWLQDNSLVGTIPTCVGEFTWLKQFRIQRNDMTGTIPEALNRCTTLTRLDLASNHLSGQLPSLVNFANLRNLRLGGNVELSGTIPASWTNLVSLQSLWVDRTKVSGTIPPGLTALKYLEDFFVYDNPGIHGTLPLFPNANIQEIRMRNNSLTGTLDAFLSYPYNMLTELDLRHNKLSGTIPSNRFPSLVDYELAGNNLVGSLPDMSNMVNLAVFDIEGNQISQTIPTTLGLLTGLITLNLADNQLSGQIPSELGRLNRLQILKLRGNALTGTVPTELTDSSNLQELPVLR